MKYFDDKNFILGLSDVGDCIEIYKLKYPEKYNRLVQKINREIKNIADILLNKYKLYHNSTNEWNICIDNNSKIRFIDFEKTYENRIKYENGYSTMYLHVNKL